VNIGKNILTWSWGDIQISKNKFFEYQFEFGKNTPAYIPFEFNISVTSKTDHAGPKFTFGIINLFWICFKVYDHRHWNHKQKRWAIPGEDSEESDLPV